MLNFKKLRKKNIVLIGLMGSGKSAVGREIAKSLNFDFYDSDAEIEKRIGKSIKQIFQTKGEEFFRLSEEEICLELLENKNCVIALGGGSIINKRIRSLINLNSFSIYLKVDIEVLLNRLRNSNKRPLLSLGNKKIILEDIYNQRKNYYKKANLIIVNNISKESVVKNIIKELS